MFIDVSYLSAVKYEYENLLYVCNFQLFLLYVESRKNGTHSASYSAHFSLHMCKNRPTVYTHVQKVS